MPGLVWNAGTARKGIGRSSSADDGFYDPVVRNEPQLIAYADRLAGDIDGIGRLLENELHGCFGGVHLLPYFDPIDGADAGFDPIDHTAVDPRIGDWDAVARLATDRDLMSDLIVNHVSSGSPQFVDWLRRGDASEHDGMFLTLDTVFPDGATEADLLAIYRPRPGLPFTPYVRADGSRRLMWTTFTGDQIDIDVEHPTGWNYLMDVLDRFAAVGVSSIRLDAAGYAVKRAGTSSFMLPETFDVIGRVAEEAHRRQMEVLVEIHSTHEIQQDIAARVDWVYDFVLPPLVLDALFSADAAPLERWLMTRPANAVTVLDTHDGIGIIDVQGMLPPDRIEALVDGIHDRTGGESRLATGSAASNLDLYQVNATFFSALGHDDVHALTARAIQVFTPGIPQVYYVGLLAGRNDVELLAATGVGRDINRHRYSRSEIATQLDRPVVRSLLELLRLRRSHPAFGGHFELLESADHELAMSWTAGEHALRLDVDLRAGTHTITS